MRDRLRISLLSGLILDGILFACMVISGATSIMRNWGASQEKATGLASVIAMGAELVISGILFGSAGALATYLALKWTRLSHQ
jgi:hypothetical protein